jgi:Nucleotidyl transferase AbiEii toxin, Type IV TA system
VNPLEIVLRRIRSELDGQDKKWSVVGGLAVSVRAMPRFTQDADLAVAVQGDRDAESLIRWLQSRGYQVLATVEQQAVGRLATVRLVPPGETPEGILLDLLFASSGIEPEIAEMAEPLEVLPGLTVPVARSSHLMAMKVLSRDDVRRPTDLADLRSLLAAASPGEIQETEKALAMITQRGYHRDRDLAGSFDEVRTSVFGH